MTEPTRVPRCERTPTKIKYLTRDDARRGARRRINMPTAFSRGRDSWQQVLASPYLCTSCGYWHNTIKHIDDDQQEVT